MVHCKKHWFGPARSFSRPDHAQTAAKAAGFSADRGLGTGETHSLRG